MVASAWSPYNGISEYSGDGTVDFDEGDGHFSVVLLTSGYSFDATDDDYADISGNEVSNANGYTTGGDILSSTDWNRSGNTTTFDSDDPTWTASGGNIVARSMVLCHIAAGSGVPQSGDKIICHALLDDTSADITVLDGSPLTITIAASGYYVHQPA